MSEHEIFRTTLMGGYDKEDVLEQFRNQKDASASERSKLQKEIEGRDQKLQELEQQLQELEQQLRERDEQKDKMKAELTEKYRKYVDHYESISRLLVESQIKGDAIVSEAEIKSERMIMQAELEAKRKTDSVQAEINEKLADGKRKYMAIQEEINEIVELINQAQKRFMSSYKEVHKIVRTMPDSIRALGDDVKEEELDDLGEIFDEDITELLKTYDGEA